MVLRVRKEVNYAEVADDDPKQRLPKVPRISDDSAGARRRAAATVDPDTKLENLDSKYANDLDARNRAIRSVVRTRSLPASCPRFLERRRRRRRTAVRVSLVTPRAPDAYTFSLATGAVPHRPADLDRRESPAVEEAPREAARDARG
jgi:hypothetical protein